MTRKKQRRLAFAVALLLAGAGAAWLIVGALKNNILYFYSPSEVVAQKVRPGVAFRIGGLVAKDSVHHAGVDVRFTVTDGAKSVPVDFHGVLPALFREGQGVVALGEMNAKGTFAASQVLAKHDEKYMPPEVVQALKKSGHWEEGGS
jgi:cytochrome c-type biogenesis protein CcmE